MLLHNPTRKQLLELLYAALAQPIGLVLHTSDTEQARQALYRARTRASDPALDVLQFKVGVCTDGDLTIYKRKVELA